MRAMQRVTATVCTAFILAGCLANSATQSGTAPARSSGGFLGLGEAKDFSVQRKNAFEGAEKVLIGGFKVAFVESKVDASQAGGGLTGGFGGRSTAFVRLTGVDGATYQKLANAAYNDFVKKLKANGYEVADRSLLIGHEKFKNVRMYDMPMEKDGSGLLHSYGMVRYYAPAAFGSQSPVFEGEIPGESGGFAYANPVIATTNFVTESGIRVLNVVYVIDFSNNEKQGNSWASRRSSVTVGQGLSVMPGALLAINAGQKGYRAIAGSIRTGQPIYTTDEFATVEDVSGSVNKGMEMGVNVVRSIGGIGTNISRKYDVNADAGKYSKLATKLLEDANSSFVSQMASFR